MKLLNFFVQIILFAIYLQTSTCFSIDVIEPNKEINIGDVQPRDIIQDLIDGILKNVTDAIVALDPVMIVDKTITLPNNPVINGQIGLTKLSVSDFKGLDISAAFQLGLFSSTLDFGTLLPMLNVHLEYDADLQFGNGSNYNANNATVDFGLENFAFTGTSKINTLALNVDSTEAHIDLGKVNLVLSGVLEDAELNDAIGKWVSDNLVNWLHDNQVVIDETIGTVITTVVNLVLKMITG